TVDMNIKTEHVGLRTALCNLIIASVTDEGADVYLALGTMHYMVQNKQARYKVSAWEPALEEIFRHHPSAKLAYTGLLDINDFTTDGFYVQKHLGEFFPTFSEILRSPHPHRQPVFIVMFQPSPVPYGGDFQSSRRRSTSLVDLSATSSGRLQFPIVPEDFNLRVYLQRLKLWFTDTAQSLQYFEIEVPSYGVGYREKCTEVSSSLMERAKLLAVFVSEQMSGLTQERDCSMPTVDLHLTKLMTELNSRVIGLGWVRVGSELERAILYKVLADRIGLPCALYRTSSAHAWCEVAMPELNTEEQDEEVSINQYPAGLRRMNYVVDLTLQPGQLHQVGSVEARRICGPKCTPSFVARNSPRACVCERHDKDNLSNDDSRVS
ncbi:uncharacterized protein LOC113238484, partial [Hyposmocoma kahamanoa]|uniref:uncharacterized protein LOC113238484 n=1 Tax=Hyposmocoma kahamanoa TaxID=1477025 RepID=UPI000E6D5D74